jgi:hypothetical protein
MKIFLSLILFSFSLAKEEPVFVNRVASEAEKNMNQVLLKSFSTLKTEDEKRSWNSAALAKIALKRLQGKELEAIAVFDSCAESCRKFGNSSEWLALNAWACERRAKTAQCPEKTKTRKPPQ